MWEESAVYSWCTNVACVITGFYQRFVIFEILVFFFALTSRVLRILMEYIEIKNMMILTVVEINPRLLSGVLATLLKTPNWGSIGLNSPNTDSHNAGNTTMCCSFTPIALPRPLLSRTVMDLLIFPQHRGQARCHCSGVCSANWARGFD